MSSDVEPLFVANGIQASFRTRFQTRISRKLTLLPMDLWKIRGQFAMYRGDTATVGTQLVCHFATLISERTS